MVHAAEGTLQAYLDGEIDAAAEAAVRDHVAGCDACAGELEALRRANGLVSETLALLEAEAGGAMLRAQARLARERRSGGHRLARLSIGSLARAAMLLLVLAGAAAAAIPELRRALVGRVTELLGGSGDAVVEQPVQETATPEALEPEEGMTFVSPSNGRVRIVLHAPAGRLDVAVRLIDGSRASVETELTSGEVRRRAGSGRLELMGLGSGTVTIGIPRDVPNATVEVDGVVSVYKEGDTLRGSGPAAGTAGTEVKFTTGS